MRSRPKLTGALLAAFVALSATASAEEFITFGTGGVTGVYYPTGGAICRLVNLGRKTHGIRCSVEATGGSVQNARAVRQHELNFGILQSDIQTASRTGTGAFSEDGPYTDLRSLFSVYAEPIHLMARADAGIRGPDDLNGKKVNVGNPGSGTRVLSDILMKYAGLTAEDFAEMDELKPSEQATALCDGKLDAAIWAAGLPNASSQEAASTCDIKMIPLAGEAIDRLLAENPAYAAAVIPGGLYPGNPEDIPSWGPKATVVTSAQTSDETVYAVVSAVFENFDDFRKLHPAFARLDPQEMIRDSLTAELHPGALKYYREKGWK